MKQYYRYPAIFYFDSDGIAIEFPDLPGCLPCADTEEEAFENAREALGLHLFGMEQDGDPIPSPTPVKNLNPEQGGI
ncbi:MAG: type II toxin-antitoxin system HicB family antitoxin, partial [Oscillibacter sp.]